MLAIARREVPGATFEVMDMRDAAALGQRFDAAFAQASLVHIPKKAAAAVLASLAATVRPGGLVYVAVKETKPDEPDEEERVELEYGYTIRRFFSYYTLEELRGLFRQANLHDVYHSVTPSGSTRWLQIIGRKAD